MRHKERAKLIAEMTHCTASNSSLLFLQSEVKAKLLLAAIKAHTCATAEVCACNNSYFT